MDIEKSLKIISESELRRESFLLKKNFDPSTKNQNDADAIDSK